MGNFNENDKKKHKENPLRLYAIYSSIVFQMLFIIGISFWGGNKLTEYYHLKNNLLTVVIGLLGLVLTMYSTLKRLEQINKNEK